MKAILGRLVVPVLTAAIMAWALPVSAQGIGSRRIALDTVIGAQDIFDSVRDWPTVGMFDLYSSVEIHRGLQASFRPKYWRLNGEWDLVFDQASIQYDFYRGTHWRIQAGRFPSPIGFGMTENRASVNGGVLWWHRPYYMPLPSLGAGAPSVSLVSAIYPNGVLVSTSGDHWDARAAVIDEAPVRMWSGNPGTDRYPNIVVGGGITPKQGLRLGVASSVGDLTKSPTGAYRMLNVEGEYAFGYTRLSGEWTRDHFDMPSGQHVAQGWTLQGQQTLTPRLYAHARSSHIRSPEVRNGAVVGRTFWSLDTAVGYRLDAELTLRLGYSAVKSASATTIDHQTAASLMWARRWW
jgi:hypothetical protein